MTFGDKIRNMSDEQLASLLTGQHSGYDYIKMLNKLKSPATEYSDYEYEDINI